MNIYFYLTLLFAFLSVCAAAGWFFSEREGARLRARLDEKSDLALDQAQELSAVKERARLIEDAHAAMSARFEVLSHQAADQLLKRAEESFVAREKLALERMDSALKPVAETLVKFEEKVRLIESERQKEAGGLKAQIEGLLQVSQATKDATHKLANTLRRGAGVQGRWGEETLRNVLQSAGLTRFDFVEQLSTDTDEGRRRPDVVVKLPGDKGDGVFVIDAKANLTAFLEATETADEVLREAHLVRHAQGLKNHVKDLAQKAYWEQFRDQSPDFVAMFVPGDGFLAAALERQPDLMNDAMQKRVIIVTPSTLFALCKAVSYGWRVEDSMKNASQIADLGRELYARLSTMGNHVLGVGKALNQAVDKYNDFVGSLETKVLTQARRFEDLSVQVEGKKIEEAKRLENRTKPLNKLEHSPNKSLADLDLE